MRLTVCLLLCAVIMSGQPQPAFEVASVKIVDPEAKRPLGTGLYTFPGGRVVASNCPLSYLIEEAFDTHEYVFPGAPGWYANDRFNIDARPPADSAAGKLNPPLIKNPPNEDQRLMLQALLAERFHLKFHRESKDGPVYLLVRGKGALGLREPKNKDEFSWAGSAADGGPFSNGIAGINISMPQFAKRLAPYLRRPVLDHTGLTGFFDFRYEYAGADQQADLIGSILASIQGLGLRLESSTAPIETIVIEHAEKPTAN